MTGPSTASARPLFLEPHEGELLRIIGDRVRILVDAGATANQCSVFETITARHGGPPLHRHVREDEFFYVIEGRAKFSVNGADRLAGPGSFVAAPRGSRHTFLNVGDGDLRMLVIVTPAGLETPFRANAQLFARSPDAGLPEITDIFRKHEIEFVGPPLSPE